MSPTLRSAKDARFVRDPSPNEGRGPDHHVFMWIAQDAAACNYQWSMHLNEPYK